jgi:pimeloyl-ACP methyl ester carboxylesterase
MWMFVRIRRQRGRLIHVLLYPVAVILALASIGGGYETLGEAVDAQAHPISGRLIDVGGHRLHLHCTGSGSPTVVLEPGGGEMSSNLGRIAPAVARNTRVCVYDRAGKGWSDSAAVDPRGTQIATDLHTLLHRAGVPGPYVLAGHSFGGLYVLTYAARYPTDVAGMVLIDSTAPKAASPDGAPPTGLIYRASALLSSSARLGLGRLWAPLEGGTLPPPFRDEVRANIATASNLRSTIDEYIDAGDAMKQAGTLTSFGGKPLVVLTAGPDNHGAHSIVQKHLATLSTNSVHRVVDGATHEALVAEKDGAAASTRGILDVVASVRSPGPLLK